MPTVNVTSSEDTLSAIFSFTSRVASPGEPGSASRARESTFGLITCGGEFEKAVRSYRSNVVVTAIPA